MNHNLGVRLEQGQFIEIRKVSGTARSEARMLSVSFFKKYFDGVQVGDFVYFTSYFSTLCTRARNICLY